MHILIGHTFILAQLKSICSFFCNLLTDFETRHIFDAFSYAFNLTTHYEHVRIYGLDLLRSVNYFKSKPLITYNKVEILIRKKMDENYIYNSKELNESIDLSVKNWKAIKNIKNLKFIQHDLQPTEGFYIFDDKFLIVGNLHTDLKTKKIEFSNDVITANSNDNYSKLLILSYIEKFNKLKLNYE